MRSTLVGLSILATGCLYAQQYVISTYAGGVPLPTLAPALSAPIGGPQGVAVDAAGNAYFTSSNAIFKLDQSGVLTRVAGNSRYGYSGDGGPATSAQLAVSCFYLTCGNGPNGLEFRSPAKWAASGVSPCKPHCLATDGPLAELTYHVPFEGRHTVRLMRPPSGGEVWGATVRVTVTFCGLLDANAAVIETLP